MSQALLVDCFKIVNWMEQRKKLGKDWYRYEKAAEEKIKNLIQTSEEYSEQPHLMRYLKDNALNFHYCDVHNFVQQVLETKWANNKSIVFGYNDIRVKNWVALDKFMASKNLDIVNTAKFISQGLRFDLPGLNKSIELLDSQISTLKRKIDYNNNVIFQQQKQSETQRARLNLAHDPDASVASQIPEMLKNTPSLFFEAHQKALGLSKFMEMHDEIVGSDQTVMRILRYFIKNGDVFTQAYQGQSEPLPQQQKYRQFYNWDPYSEWVIETQGESRGQSKQLQTILQNKQIRQQLVEDLSQLLYFAKGLHYQTTRKVGGLEQKSDNLVPSEISAAMVQIEGLLNTINQEIAPRVEIKNNSRVYEILVRKFQGYDHNIRHMRTQNQSFIQQIQEMGRTREQLVQQLQQLRSRLTHSKNQCEVYLTNLLKRQIRITGEINKLE